MTPSRESTFDRRFRRIYGAIVGVIALLGLLLVYSGFAEIKTRIYDVDALLTGDPQATPDDRFEQLQTRLRCHSLLGVAHDQFREDVLAGGVDPVKEGHQ